MGIKGLGRAALVAAVLTGTLVGQQPVTRAQDLPGGESSTCSAGEVESRRTKKTKTVLNEDCTYTVTFGQNLHYEAAPGRWEAVDLDFRRDGSDFVADRNSTTVRISGGRVDVTDSETGSGIRWLVPNPPAVRGHRATFTAQGLEWEYAVTDTGVKLGALVTDPRGPKSYEFPYRLLGGDGDLAVDADGNLQGTGFFIPRPVAFGSDHQSYPAGRWRLLSGHRVGFDFDDAGLPAEAYPYILDPSTVMHEANSSDDGTVTKWGYSYPPSGCSGWHDSSSTMYAMRSRNPDGQYRTNNAFMRWHTGSIPTTRPYPWSISEW